MEGSGKVRTAALSALAVSIAVLAVAGCGDGDGDTAAGDDGATTTELTRAAYLKRANAGCRRARAGLEQSAARFLRLQPQSKPAPELYADLAHLVLLPAVEDELEAVLTSGVPPGPPSEEDKINSLLYAEEAVLNNLAVRTRIPSREYVERKFVKPAQLLRDYGLAACANGIRLSREEGKGT